MVEVDYVRKMELMGPGELKALVEASEGETITVDFRIWGGSIDINADSSASNVATLEFTNGAKQATVRLTGATSDVKCTVHLWGDQ